MPLTMYFGAKTQSNAYVSSLGEGLFYVKM